MRSGVHTPSYWSLPTMDCALLMEKLSGSACVGAVVREMFGVGISGGERLNSAVNAEAVHSRKSPFMA